MRRSLKEEEKGDDMGKFANMPCVEDTDCGKSKFLVCKDVMGSKLCKHKPIFPLAPIEISGTIVLMILMALAVMSGIGGGGIIVPLLMVFYKLSTKEAVAVSGFTILVGSISRFAFTY